MKKFLALSRRLFLMGTISLVIIVILVCLKYKGLVFKGSEMIGSYYALFAIASPVIWLLLWIVSAAYIRKFGQSAAYQQTIKFSKTLGIIIKDDITAPFRLIIEQFASRKKLIKYYSQVVQDEIAGPLADGSKAINFLKLQRMIIVYAFCIIGILTTVSTVVNTMKVV